MRVAYYPGCSLLSGAKEYDLSVRAVFAHLGIELVEIEDWNCCGAVHSDVNSDTAGVALAGRNLALAERQELKTVVAPCSGCYLNLRRASKAISATPAVREQVNAQLEEGLAITGDVEVVHPLYLLLNEVGLEAVRKHVTRPLSALRIASYYGCMLTRPKDVFDSTERPTGFDQLVQALGASPVEYPYKAKCCGGALAISHGDVTARLTGAVLSSAKASGADAVTLGCPMCHTALDGYQRQAERSAEQKLELPVLYFTQLMGLAFGLEPGSLGLSRHLVPTDRLVAMLA